VAHWKHLASVVPPAQLTLGSDFNGMISRPAPGGSCPDGVRNTGDLETLYGALVKHGVPQTAIDGMGWRFLELWEALEKRADPAVREHALEANPYPASPFDVAM
jgi:microsomal dipeptidase-like Zn-dependent dipeptidase